MATHHLMARPIELVRQIGALQLPPKEAQVEILRVFQSLPAAANEAGTAAKLAADRLRTSFLASAANDLYDTGAKWQKPVESGIALVRRYLIAHKHLLDRVFAARRDESSLNIPG